MSHPPESARNRHAAFGSLMFVCQICGRIVPPRTPAARIFVARRPKQYPFRHHANVYYRPDSNGKVKEHQSDDPGGVGWEIVREALACSACAGRLPQEG